MAYEKHTWVNNETITAAKMNNIEDGIEEAAQSGGGGAVIIIDDGTALDKTFAEIYDLVESGTPCYISYTDRKAQGDLDTTYGYDVDLSLILMVFKYNANYRIVASNTGCYGFSNVEYVGVPGATTYQASSSNDYPTFLRHTTVKVASLDISTYR